MIWPSFRCYNGLQVNLGVWNGVLAGPGAGIELGRHSSASPKPGMSLLEKG